MKVLLGLHGAGGDYGGFVFLGNRLAEDQVRTFMQLTEGVLETPLKRVLREVTFRISRGVFRTLMRHAIFFEQIIRAAMQQKARP